MFIDMAISRYRKGDLTLSGNDVIEIMRLTRDLLKDRKELTTKVETLEEECSRRERRHQKIMRVAQTDLSAFDPNPEE